MSEEYKGQIAEAPMAETWKRWPGQTVNGEFQLREYLGGSAHGAVYLTDYDHQPAAIHLVSESSPDKERQLASWQLATELSHPNLTRIFQVGLCQIDDVKLFYAVMEFADENLGQILTQRALTSEETTQTLNPTLGALAYLHGRGLVHGGINPANIMASGDQIKLSSSCLGRAGEPIRDPGNYDPPEALSSSAGDVWSLGMTLVEVLTQRLPSWHRNAQGDPDIPETLPAPLLDVARHCLRREASRRWSAQEIAEHLDPSTVHPAPQKQVETVAVAEPMPPRPEQAPPRLKQTPPVTPKRPAAASQSVTTVVRAKQAARGSATPKKNRYVAPVVILLLVLTGFAGVKFLNRSSNSDIQALREIEKPSESVTQPPQTPPQPAASAIAPESDTNAATPSATTPSEQPKPSSLRASETLAPIRPKKAPDASTAGAADAAVIRQVLPDVLPRAQRSIRGTVRVGIKVTVNESGEVADAMIESTGPSRYFSNLALQAARQWKFAPGGNVAGTWILRFDFTADGVKASAKPSAS
jgi:TonB family protein